MFFIKDNRGVNVNRERGAPLPKELEEDPALENGTVPLAKLAVWSLPAGLRRRSRRSTNHDIAEDVKPVGGILEIEPGSRVYETTVPLLAGQTVEYGLLGLPVPQVDAEGKTGSDRYPPMPLSGQPGVAFLWIDIEGPIAPPAWPPASHRVLFDDLGVEPQPSQPRQEASRLLRR